MPRTPKAGMDYFPLDVAFFEDVKVKKLRRKHGSLGLIIYVNLLCRIYQKGYYLEFSDFDELCYDIAEQVLSDKNNRDISKIQQVILYIEQCALINIIESVNFGKKVITSYGIQKQYIVSMQKMKRQINMDFYRLNE